MTQRTKLARKVCNSNLALSSNSNSTKLQDLLIMQNSIQTLNSGLGVKHQDLTLVPTRSWSEYPERHVFGLELSLAKDNSFEPYPPAHDLFQWIHKNGAETLLYKALDQFAPLQPTISYRGLVSMWYSAPMSGSGNTVGIIIGKDDHGELRVIGTNFMSAPKAAPGMPNPNLFQYFDSLKRDLDKSEFIQQEIALRMTPFDIRRSKIIEHDGYKFRTMPIYILVFDDYTSLVASEIAYVDGDHPSNMSLEFVGDIR